MKENLTLQAGERTQEYSSFPVDIAVKSFGNWALGYGWVNVSLGGSSTTGLALYARQTGRNGEQKNPVRRVVFNFTEATNWLLDTAKVPNRAAGKLMAEAIANGGFGETCKNETRIAVAERTPPQHTPGPWEVQTPFETSFSIVEAGKESYEWEFIADVSFAEKGESGFSFQTAVANAQLICAAPELLATLENLVEAIWDGRMEADGAEVYTDPARSLIAKARGEK